MLLFVQVPDMFLNFQHMPALRLYFNSEDHFSNHYEQFFKFVPGPGVLAQVFPIIGHSITL